MAASPQFSYVPEWDAQFLSLFPHRFDYIFSAFPQPGQKPTWRTESRHPLSDRILNQGSCLFGVRFGPETRYALIDIDHQSAYHPAQDAQAIERLLASLEPLGLVSPIICTSSYSQGLHLYFPFAKAQRSWKLASAIATLVEASGFKLKSGQLEIFPNTKRYATTGSPSLFNAHRLPLQEPGAYLLNRDLEPIQSSQGQFAQLWARCQHRNDLDKAKIRTVLKQQKRTRHFISEKADKYLNDLNAEIEPGWTGKGQTNRLLGRITMRCFVFHHVIAGGQPLNGQALIDEVIATATSLPGYKTWCRHRHEIGKRVTDWVRSIENSHYFPYGSPQGKYKAATTQPKSSGSSWNQKQAIATQEKIKQAISKLENSSRWPEAITARFQTLTKAGISGSSLYKYKWLWHPKYQTKEAKPASNTECPPARPKGAANWHSPTSLLCENDCNLPSSEDLGDFDLQKMSNEGRNSLPGKDFSYPLNEGETNSSSAIAKIKHFLAFAQKKREAAKSILQPDASNDYNQRATTNLTAYLEQLQGYLRSGDTVLVEEALDILAWRPDYLEAPAISAALEQCLAQLSPSKPIELARAALIRILQQLSKLKWTPEKLAKFLEHRGKPRLKALTLEELEALQEQLRAESG